LAGRRALFESLWNGAPAEAGVERSRFLTLWINALASSERGDPGTPPADLPQARRQELARELIAVLGDRELRNTNLELVLYFVENANWLAPEPGAARDELISAWNAAARGIEEDEALTVGERIMGLEAEIGLAQLDGDADAKAPLPEALRQRILERIRWASDAVTDEDELQGVMNTMAHILEDAGLIPEAKQLLAERTAQTRAPYYYLGWQASLAEDAGEKEEAVRLSRQAWQGARDSGSENGMTPLRWAATYVGRATKLTPEAVETIAADTSMILDDALASPDAFSGGNWARLQRIRGSIEGWQKDDAARAKVLEELDQRVATACAKLSDEGPDSPGGRCRSLTASAAG